MKSLKIALLALVACLVLPSCTEIAWILTNKDPKGFDPKNPPANYPPPPPKEVLDGNYKIRPLDVLSIELFQELEAWTQNIVTKDGEMDFKLLGRVKVAGKTTYELKDMLTKLYTPYYTDPIVTVKVVAYAPRYVIIDGFVGRTGPLPFTETSYTLNQALTQVGVQLRGDRANVRLTRKTTTVENGKELVVQKTYMIDAAAISRGSMPDLPLAEDDIIFVEDITF